MGNRAEPNEKWGRKSHYPLLDTDEIAKLPISKIAANNSILFLWATGPKLDEALEVMYGWGFEYKTIAFVWAKANPTSEIIRQDKDVLVTKGFAFGMGYYTRSGCEIVLLGTRGKVKRVDASVPQLLVAPRGKHSAKPYEIRDRIVKLVGDLPRIELFAVPPDESDSKQKRDSFIGWDLIGNAISGRDIREGL